jgi:signal peptidase II
MTTATTDRPAHTNRGWWAYRWFWVCAVAVFVLDHLSKAWVVHLSGYTLGRVPPLSGTEIIPGFFNLIYTVNYGAAWGLGEGLGWLFVLIAVVVLGAIYRFRRALELLRLPYQIAFGLVSGGIVGNSLDRVLRGHVVDFLDFDLQFYRWPTFNIADSGIVLGALFLFVYGQFLDPRTRAPKPARPRS